MTINKKEKIIYNFAKEFTSTPGPRYKRLGDSSGEEFRDDILKKLLNEYEIIEIDGSDIITSFNPSFLSEAFVPLLIKMGKDEFFRRIKLYSKTNPRLEEKFRQYVEIVVK